MLPNVPAGRFPDSGVIAQTLFWVSFQPDVLRRLREEMEAESPRALSS